MKEAIDGHQAFQREIHSAWKRHQSADRAEIILDPSPKRDVRLPRQVGFINGEGTVMQTSPEHARRMGLEVEEMAEPLKKKMTRKERKHLKKLRLGY